jgi:hypothetical protein
MRTRILLFLALIVLPITLTAVAKDTPEETKEKRELLANHETLAVFDGLKYRLCMGRTALCPKQCGHSGEFATLTVKKYLKYEKLGQYGDPEQKTFLVQVSDYDKKPKGDPKILETVKGLKKGDYVLLSWHHDYVTKEGASSPERPIVKLESIDGDKAKELPNAPAAPAAKEEKKATMKEIVGSITIDIAAKKPADQIKVKIEGDTATVDVSSQSGIGGATVTLTKGRWPTTVILRLHLSGLESLAVSNGKVKLTGSVLSHSGNTKRLYLTEEGKDGEREPGTEIKVLDAAGKPVKGLPDKGGYFEIKLPKALLDGGPKSLELGWIDFYRG